MHLGKKVALTVSHRLGLAPPGPYRPGRANWDSKMTRLLLQLAIKEIEAEGRGTTQLLNNSLCNIFTEISARTGEVINLKQFKNRYGVMKRDWQAWILLADSRRGATGLVAAFGQSSHGNSEVCHVFDPNSELSHAFQSENVAKFRNRPLEHEELMQRAFEEVTATGSLQCTPGAEGELDMGADGRRALAIDNDDLTDTDGEGNTIGIENGEEIGSEYTSGEHGVMANLRWGNCGTLEDIGRGTFDFGNFTSLLETGVYPENDPIFNSENGGNDLPNFNYPIVHQQSNELYQNGEGFGNMPGVNRFATTGQGDAGSSDNGPRGEQFVDEYNSLPHFTNEFGDDADSEYSIPADEFYAEFPEDELLVDLLTIALLHAIQILLMPQRLPFHTSSVSCKGYLHELMTSRDERHVHKILTCMRRGFTVDKFKPTRWQDETHEYLDRRDIYKPFKVDLVLASMEIHNYIRRDREADNFFAPVSSAYEYAFEDLPDEDLELENRLDDRDDIVDEDNVPEMNNVRNNIRSALRRLRRRGNRVA
ncbi:hypothetical protein RHSIM_Rhsim05G0142100 [Rhododendron simsii]|uniref:Myb/SANT-like domain-containing protein n=1 Tax=Rhododendron simsii TaxID=118357 RepID=A0A834GVR9_RHOSS|nr:hypothetical protein RHSIM_Rhsim05G0142100 [Rhododendron simsii]